MRPAKGQSELLALFLHRMDLLPPEPLVLMGALAITMFAGITVLALRMKARAYPDGFPSVISQLGAGLWGSGSAVFLLFQLATAAILVLDE